MCGIVLFPVALCIFGAYLFLDLNNEPLASPLFVYAVRLLLLCILAILAILFRVNGGVVYARYMPLVVLTC